jgi:DNA-binding NtrC family response regulator
VQRFANELKKKVDGVHPEAMKVLMRHNWPGNIRELENVLERTILFTKGDRIERADLQLVSSAAEPASQSQPVPMLHGDGEGDESAELSGSLKEAVRAETARVERELIVKALDETHGNVTQAARLLKISRKSLQMKMKEFGLRDREG